ncbi:hypothetical protein BU24DRAFT_404392 [Aaosphaeria arxii CBS 175.79]|uniref:Uncharacterized protein n=1 Tax=Aaosphaeria arxii CBS 175.79 TaxID=1450172 RepID=A0A6A5Y764_9PLEO|nr:uncharacterized protein BU24DRAFT_404392 [Aaosphaeria arxii CBS 175.79]KAF2021378.1 hypothetical protein BU24DRAFT_404392 [Aaosphaeria arxii CBS 175.79]
MPGPTYASPEAASRGAEEGATSGHRRRKFEEYARDDPNTLFLGGKPQSDHTQATTIKEMGWFSDLGNEGGTSDAIIRVAFMSEYLCTHEISGRSIWLLHKDIQSGSNKAYLKTRQVNKMAQNWQCKICTDFLLPTARHLVARCKDQGIDLLAVSSSERKTYIQDSWPKDTKDMITLIYRMYQPIIGHVDLGSIFSPPEGISIERRRLCKKWRDFLKSVWFRGIEETIDIRVRAQTNPDGNQEQAEEQRKTSAIFFDCWRDMTTRGVVPKCPPISDLIVLPDGLSSNRKRRRVSNPSKDTVPQEDHSEPPSLITATQSG